jgi:hypothetical protein
MAARGSMHWTPGRRVHETVLNGIDELGDCPRRRIRAPRTQSRYLATLLLLTEGVEGPLDRSLYVHVIAA